MTDTQIAALVLGSGFGFALLVYGTAALIDFIGWLRAL